MNVCLSEVIVESRMRSLWPGIGGLYVKLQVAVGPTMIRHMMASAVVSAPSRSEWIGAEDQGGGRGGRRSITIIADRQRRHIRSAYVGTFRGYAPSIQSPVCVVRSTASQPLDFAVQRKRLKSCVAIPDYQIPSRFTSPYE